MGEQNEPAALAARANHAPELLALQLDAMVRGASPREAQGVPLALVNADVLAAAAKMIRALAAAPAVQPVAYMVEEAHRKPFLVQGEEVETIREVEQRQPGTFRVTPLFAAPQASAAPREDTEDECISPDGACHFGLHDTQCRFCLRSDEGQRLALVRENARVAMDGGRVPDASWLDTAFVLQILDKALAALRPAAAPVDAREREEDARWLEERAKQCEGSAALRDGWAESAQTSTFRQQYADRAAGDRERAARYRRAAAALASEPHLRGEIDWLRECLRTARDMVNGDYWYWQGDGTDHLESLVCPVVIAPDVLAAALRGALPDGGVHGLLAAVMERAFGSDWRDRLYRCRAYGYIEVRRNVFPTLPLALADEVAAALSGTPEQPASAQDRLDAFTLAELRRRRVDVRPRLPRRQENTAPPAQGGEP